EEQHPVAQYPCRLHRPRNLLDGDDVRQMPPPRRLDQAHMPPGLAQHVRVVELQPIQIQLHRRPRADLQQPGEVIRQLLGAQVIDPLVEVRTDPAHAQDIRIDRL
ncbi:MAG TPA: hypothetical protein DDY14_17040, partial [Chromatiaceae bacterium]|nr:hypothetical protein [Chromatiaceae bacterium]